MDIWDALESELPDKPSGPEIFTAVFSKLKFVNSSTVQKMTTNIIALNIIIEPGYF